VKSANVSRTGSTDLAGIMDFRMLLEHQSTEQKGSSQRVSSGIILSLRLWLNPINKIVSILFVIGISGRKAK
jgi:hypothetical protein